MKLQEICSSFKHSGGEIHLNLNNLFMSNIIRFDLLSSDSIMEMLLAVNAIKNVGINDISAIIPYIPYGRADRIMPNGGGDALGIKVMADIINSCGFKTVYTLDTHSAVTDALINNVVVEKPFKIIKKALEDRDSRVCTFISPDAGAEKKIYAYAKTFGANICRATKKRNVQTGEIESIKLIDEIPERHFVYVIDDICDGGRTFIELAKILPKKCEPYLVVSHGIFSKGTEELTKYYKKIYTSDSFNTPATETLIKVNVWKELGLD